MKIIGKIDSPATGSCDRCGYDFKRGEEVVLNALYGDVLGWTARNIKHVECKRG